MFCITSLSKQNSHIIISGPKLSADDGQGSPWNTCLSLPPSLPLSHLPRTKYKQSLSFSSLCSLEIQFLHLQAPSLTHHVVCPLLPRNKPRSLNSIQLCISCPLCSLILCVDILSLVVNWEIPQEYLDHLYVPHNALYSVWYTSSKWLNKWRPTEPVAEKAAVDR